MMPSKQVSLPQLKTLLTGLAMGESPRWHEDRLWFSDWGAQEVVAADLDGNSEVVVRTSFGLPFCIDWLPDGRLLIVSGREGLLLRQEPGGSLVTHADLHSFSDKGWNEIVVDGRGNTYINGGPGIIALVAADRSARQVADGIAFPNGMAVTPDNATLIIAESHGKRLTAFDISADEPACVGRSRRRRPRWHLPRRRQRRLVRRRAQQTLRTRPRRWGGAADNQS
jgi:sugar lactone lactonase YvrE